MLKILFSPSEGKNSGGTEKKSDILGGYGARSDILNSYNDIVKSKNEEQITKLFGFKKFSDCKPYIDTIFDTEYMAAIERYNGVAYEYLDYPSLDKSAQEYLKKNTIIFSNLYGAILGGNAIANYKVKQGNSIGTIVPDKFYKERFSYQLDLFLASDEILDLRAGYYDKFYKPNKTFTTLKFLKNGKSVSHWAKAYRGKVLRELAKHTITSIKELLSLEIEGLHVKEILKTKKKTEIVFDIED